MGRHSGERDHSFRHGGRNSRPPSPVLLKDGPLGQADAAIAARQDEPVLLSPQKRHPCNFFNRGIAAGTHPPGRPGNQRRNIASLALLTSIAVTMLVFVCALHIRIGDQKAGSRRLSQAGVRDTLSLSETCADMEGDENDVMSVSGHTPEVHMEQEEGPYHAPQEAPEQRDTPSNVGALEAPAEAPKGTGSSWISGLLLASLDAALQGERSSMDRSYPPPALTDSRPERKRALEEETADSLDAEGTSTRNVATLPITQLNTANVGTAEAIEGTAQSKEEASGAAVAQHFHPPWHLLRWLEGRQIPWSGEFPSRPASAPSSLQSRQPSISSLSSRKTSAASDLATFFPSISTLPSDFPSRLSHESIPTSFASHSDEDLETPPLSPQQAPMNWWLSDWLSNLRVQPEPEGKPYMEHMGSSSLRVNRGHSDDFLARYPLISPLALEPRPGPSGVPGLPQSHEASQNQGPGDATAQLSPTLPTRHSSSIASMTQSDILETFRKAFDSALAGSTPVPPEDHPRRNSSRADSTSRDSGAPPSVNSHDSDAGDWELDGSALASAEDFARHVASSPSLISGFTDSTHTRSSLGSPNFSIVDSPLASPAVPHSQSRNHPANVAIRPSFVHGHPLSGVGSHEPPPPSTSTREKERAPAANSIPPEISRLLARLPRDITFAVSAAPVDSREGSTVPYNPSNRDEGQSANPKMSDVAHPSPRRRASTSSVSSLPLPARSLPRASRSSRFVSPRPPDTSMMGHPPANYESRGTLGVPGPSSTGLGDAQPDHSWSGYPLADPGEHRIFTAYPSPGVTYIADPDDGGAGPSETKFKTDLPIPQRFGSPARPPSLTYPTLWTQPPPPPLRSQLPYTRLLVQSPTSHGLTASQMMPQSPSAGLTNIWTNEFLPSSSEFGSLHQSLGFPPPFTYSSNPEVASSLLYTGEGEGHSAYQSQETGLRAPALFPFLLPPPPPLLPWFSPLHYAAADPGSRLPQMMGHMPWKRLHVARNAGRSSFAPYQQPSAYVDNNPGGSYGNAFGAMASNMLDSTDQSHRQRVHLPIPPRRPNPPPPPYISSTVQSSENPNETDKAALPGPRQTSSPKDGHHAT